ncbi:hypothetical protein DFH07DRAFT_767135 [Mycena maculata]|uniref:Uncharacterized protein n=1 Tax=Mycena maculata TaxID=230809 RepID=A0AAD7K0M9_9AGAR|nr:hypothetical protein DFH07DRAFT_767135 [Mycena maculata]
MPMEPPLDDKEFPDSITVPIRTTQSMKGKSEVTSDISDANLATPAKKKLGPKPKVQTVKPTSEVNSSKPDNEPKPAKKPGSKPKPKANQYQNPENRKKCGECPGSFTEIMFMIPEATTEGNQCVSVKYSTSFDNAIELMQVNLWWFETLLSRSGAVIVVEKKDAC